MSLADVFKNFKYELFLPFLNDYRLVWTVADTSRILRFDPPLLEYCATLRKDYMSFVDWEIDCHQEAHEFDSPLRWPDEAQDCASDDSDCEMILLAYGSARFRQEAFFNPFDC